MIGNLFATTLAKVSAGIVAVLLAMCAFLWIGWNRADAETERAKAVAVRCDERHAITKASVARLEQVMAELIHDGEVRVERVSDAMAQARQETREAEIEAEAIRRAPVRSDCVTPDAIMRSNGL